MQLIVRTVAVALMALSSMLTYAQQDSVRVFGYDYPRDSNDSVKRLFNPSFMRLGVNVGAAYFFHPDRNRPTPQAGFRFEYGFKNGFTSLVFDAQSYGPSVGVNFLSKKSTGLVQPYAGLGVGIMDTHPMHRNPDYEYRSGGHRRGGHPMDWDNTVDDSMRADHISPMAYARAGINILLRPRWVGNLEANYLQPLTMPDGYWAGLNLRAGLSYQFGRRK